MECAWCNQGITGGEVHLYVTTRSPSPRHPFAVAAFAFSEVMGAMSGDPLIHRDRVFHRRCWDELDRILLERAE